MAVRGVDDIQVVSEQAALLRVAVLVARAAPQRELFAAVAEEAARALAVDAGAVLRYVGEERAVVVGSWRADGKRTMPVNAELDFGRTTSALGLVRSRRRPARVAGYENARGELPIVMKSIGMRASVAAPVLAGGEVWGALVASATDEAALPAGSEQRLTGLAELVTQALAN